MRSILRGAWQRWRRLAYRARLACRTPEVGRDRIAVNYGGALNAGANDVVHGGRVKLRHLQEVFSEQERAFNVLYLVSSALPPFAEDLVDWARRRGVCFVWNQNGVAYPAWAGAGYDGINAPLRRLLQRADYVIYQSEFCRQSADRYLGPVGAPWQIVYNCVDVDAFAPRKTALARTPWVLLATGSHLQAARVISVLETVTLLRQRGRDIRLIVAGRLGWEGAEVEVRDTIRALGIETCVVLRPPYTQAEAPELYRSAHILMHTKYKDPCPTVPIEAMACGLPVVGSRSGGMPELVGEDAGILIDVPETWEHMPVPDAGAMADAVVRIFDDLDEWSGRARRRAVLKFGKEGWVRRHREIFASALAGGAGQGLRTHY